MTSKLNKTYKIIITGKSGLLATDAKEFFNKICTTYKVGRDDVNYLNYSNVNEVFNKLKPNLIIHCAANTNVEECETNPKQTYKDNVESSSNIVKYCKINKIKLIYISSTGIYGNWKKEPYIETDKILPTTVYHKTKYEAEIEVKKHLSNYLIIRTGWLFTDNFKIKKNFIKARFNESKNKDEIYSDSTQYGNPTYSKDLIKCIYTLLIKNLTGTYNCINKNYATRYDYVKEIIDKFNLNTIVKKTSNSSFNRIAKVSFNEAALNYNLEKNNIYYMRDWKDALSEAIITIKKNLNK